MFERFSDRGRRVLVLAQEEARLLDHGFIGTEHILLGLLSEGDGIAAKVLQSLGVGLDAARVTVEGIIGPVEGHGNKDAPPFTPRAKKALELSLREALQLGHNYIGTEHLLLGLLREGEGVAVRVLEEMGAPPPRVRVATIAMLQGEPLSPSMLENLPLRGRGGFAGGHGPSGSLSGLGRFWRRATNVASGSGPGSGFEPLPPSFALNGQVDLVHEGDRLWGTVAGSPVDLELTVPRGEGRAGGTFAGMEVSATWQLGANGAWRPDVPCSLHATFAGEPARLLGWFHLEPEFFFDHASIEGELAEAPIRAFVAGGEDEDGSTGAFNAHGVFAGADFSLRGSASPGDTAVVTGSVSGRPVDLRCAVQPGSPPRRVLTGSFDGPAPLLLALAGAMLFFA